MVDQNNTIHHCRASQTAAGAAESLINPNINSGISHSLSFQRDRETERQQGVRKGDQTEPIHPFQELRFSYNNSIVIFHFFFTWHSIIYVMKSIKSDCTKAPAEWIQHRILIPSHCMAIPRNRETKMKWNCEKLLKLFAFRIPNKTNRKWDPEGAERQRRRAEGCDALDLQRR